MWVHPFCAISCHLVFRANSCHDGLLMYKNVPVRAILIQLRDRAVPGCSHGPPRVKCAVSVRGKEAAGSGVLVHATHVSAVCRERAQTVSSRQASPLCHSPPEPPLGSERYHTTSKKSAPFFYGSPPSWDVLGRVGTSSCGAAQRWRPFPLNLHL